MIVIAKLDWTITSPEARLKCVKEVLEENPTPNEAYLELMGTYLTECMEKQEKKEKIFMQYGSISRNDCLSHLGMKLI